MFIGLSAAMAETAKARRQIRERMAALQRLPEDQTFAKISGNIFSSPISYLRNAV
jgi:hypothetical protein